MCMAGGGVFRYCMVRFICFGKGWVTPFSSGAFSMIHLFHLFPVTRVPALSVIDGLGGYPFFFCNLSAIGSRQHADEHGDLLRRLMQVKMVKGVCGWWDCQGLQKFEFQHKNQNMVGFQTVGLIPFTKFSITHLCNLRKLQRLKTPTEKSQMVVWSGILPHWLRKLPISPQKRFGKSQVISPVLRFAVFFQVQYWFKTLVFFSNELRVSVPSTWLSKHVFLNYNEIHTPLCSKNI